MTIRVLAFAGLLAAMLGTGCLDDDDVPAAPGPAAVVDPEAPPHARWELADGLKEDMAIARHPSDGGGRAWIEDGGDVGRAEPGRWTVVYEAGPLGVAVGGAIYLQVSPFWQWSDPQGYDERSPGFTRAETDADGVVLEPGDSSGFNVRTAPFIVNIGGRALTQGEQVRITYGAGPMGARADRYAERESRFWLAVDGDGDGVRKLLADSPAIDVLPGPPAGLLLTVTSTARPGDRVRVAAAVLDAVADAWVDIEGELEWQGDAADLSLPGVTFAAADRGAVTAEFPAPGPGVYRLAAKAPGGLEAVSNPLVVSEDAVPILWGDLHGHSNFSDGTGTPEDYYRYARDISALDVAVLTDHDHWGLLFIDQHPELWDRIRQATLDFHEPGRFVTLVGYEWTNWIHGHRHVLYFSDEGELLSSMDDAYETPAQLWAALSDRDDVLTMAHHSAGGPIPTNWAYRPDPRIEPVTEVISVHGSSEAMDPSFARIYSPIPGNFVRDVLDDGLQFGFVGSGDSHDGHPGLAHLANANGLGGVAALVGAQPDRASVLETLRARSTYATSGPRIVLQFELDGAAAMGRTVPARDAATVTARVWGTAPLTWIDLVRGGAGPPPSERNGDGDEPRHTIHRVEVEGEVQDAETDWSLSALRPGEYLYLRVLQEDGSLAWSSPIFFE